MIFVFGNRAIQTKKNIYKAIKFILEREYICQRSKDRECTLITTAVTPLSTQKYVPDLRAYCSENFLIISTDLSDGSAERTSTLFL